MESLANLAVPVAVTAGVALTAILVMVVRRRLMVVVVRGGSMTPTYQAGQRVLVSRRVRGVLAPGDIVVFRPPVALATDRLIKRVIAVGGDPVPEWAMPPTAAPVAGVRVPAGSLVVAGDSPDSLDSRSWGYLPATNVFGVVRRTL